MKINISEALDAFKAACPTADSIEVKRTISGDIEWTLFAKKTGSEEGRYTFAIGQAETFDQALEDVLKEVGPEVEKTYTPRFIEEL